MPNVGSVFHGSESILYLGPKIWDVVPLELKELTSIDAFKKGIKQWKSENCPCGLCKKYVSNLGSIKVTSWAFLIFFIYLYIVLKIYFI